MSVKLLNMKTAKFLQEPERWTEREEEAREFGGGTDALLYCYRHHLTNMRIRGRFPDPRQNFDIKLTGSFYE